MKRIVLTSLVAAAAIAAPAAQSGQKPKVFKLNTQTISVDVVVRDSSGKVVPGLTRDDFEVFEDGKAEQITSFAFEHITEKPQAVETANVLAGAEAKLKSETGYVPPAAATPAPAAAAAAEAPTPMTSEDLAGHRLIVLLFDIASMQPDDVQRAIDSANKYVNTQMTPADMVAVATISTQLDVVTDLTGDKSKVTAALNKLGYQDGTATPPPTASTTATDEAASNDDTSSQDTSDMDMFNNDVRLRAIKALSESMSSIEQKKSILYFSAGMQRSGEDNQVELRAASNAAVRAHVSIYSVDVRGLQAMVPGGDATHASARGTQLFSGAGVSSQYATFSAQQDTLSSLSVDTGGHAFLDSNDFGEAFERVEKDMSAYYLIGYQTSSIAKDGRYHRIQVKLKKPGLKVDARQGYYAARDFAHTASADRATEMQDQLYSTDALAATDLPVLVSASYFRLAPDKYYVPISTVVPGSALPPPAEKDKDKVQLDILGLVKDEQGRPVGQIQQTFKLPPGSIGSLTSRQILYETPLTLPPGHFSVKVVVRENTTGLMGTFEAPVIVPDLKQTPLKLSSVILATQRQPATGKTADNPLVKNGEQLLPDITHIVGKDQTMYFYYEVYDPTQSDNAPDVRTSLAFYKGRVKVFETPVIERSRIDDPSRKAAVFQLEVPAGSIPAGFYTCQINVIDAVSGKFAFPRLSFLVR